MHTVVSHFVSFERIPRNVAQPLCLGFVLTYLHFGSVGKLSDSQETLLQGLFGPHLQEMPGFEHRTCRGNL
jgi:hypothetical protein